MPAPNLFDDSLTNKREKAASVDCPHLSVGETSIDPDNLDHGCGWNAPRDAVEIGLRKLDAAIELGRRRDANVVFFNRLFAAPAQKNGDCQYEQGNGKQTNSDINILAHRTIPFAGGGG